MKCYELPLGAGPECLFREDISGRRAVIMPNLAQIARVKDFLRDRGGFLHIDFFTFDDLTEILAIDAPRGEGEALFYFRKHLREGHTVFRAVESLEKLQSLFRLLEAMDVEGVNYEELPYSWRGEIPDLLDCYQVACEEANFRGKLSITREALASKVYEKRVYDVFGFTGFSRDDRALLHKLDKVCDVRIYLPFKSYEDGATRFLKKDLPALDFMEGNIVESKISAFKSLQRERVLRHVVDDVYHRLTNCPDLKIGVMVLHRSDRDGVEKSFDLAGIPVAREVLPLDENGVFSLLRLFWRLDDKIPNLAAFLRSPLCTMEEGRRLAQILESLSMDDLSDWESRRSLRLFLEEEEKDLLFRSMDYLEKLSGFGKGSFDDFARRTGEISHILDPESREILLHAMEMQAGDYGELTGEEFESILRSGMEGEGCEGVNITSLTAGFGYDYDVLYVLGLDQRFPCAAGENDLVHYTNIESLQKAGLFPDYLDPERDSLALSYSVASAKEALLYKWGDGEEASLFAEFKGDVVDLDEVGEVFPNKDMLMTSEEGFGEEARVHRLEEMQGASFSPSAVDLYLSCPFKYFAGRVLNQEVDGLIRERRLSTGNLYHDLLARYFQGDLEKGELEEALARGFDDTVGHTVADYLRPILKRDMLRALLATIENEESRLDDEKRNKGFHPARFEAPFTYPFGDYSVRGVIDRIDEDDNGREVLIDYKAKNTPSFDSIMAYEAMQLAMYAGARRFIDKKVVSLEYVSIEKGTESVMLRNVEDAGGYYRLRRERGISGEEFGAFLDGAERALQETIDSIVSGDFPAEPNNESVCGYCEFVDLCRKESLCFD